ncbi:hypothetical protein GJ496_005490 [Pomphorhynchus laevis]|nr:hypothetical protein GJ496_005490 [Pomphorhynchus laevis]
MSTNYIAGVHKPTAVTDAVCGQFFHNTHPDLIVAKGSLLEFYSVRVDNTDGSHHPSVRLQLEKDFQIFGEIASLKLIKANGHRLPNKNLLFFITNKQHAAFIEPSSDDSTAAAFASDNSANDESFRKISTRNQQLFSEDEQILTKVSTDKMSALLASVLQSDQQTFYCKPSTSQQTINNYFVKSQEQKLKSSEFLRLRNQFDYHPVHCDMDASRVSRINQSLKLLSSRRRNRSCPGISSDTIISHDQSVPVKQRENQYAHSSEFSHLQGPFWSKLNTRKFLPKSLVSTFSTIANTSSSMDSITTKAVEWIKNNLSEGLVNRLCTLRPSLRLQLDKYNSKQPLSTTDVDMDYNEVSPSTTVRQGNDQGQQAILEGLDAMSDEKLVDYIDNQIARFQQINYHSLISTSSEHQCSDIVNSIDERIDFQRQLLHAQISYRRSNYKTTIPVMSSAAINSNEHLSQHTNNIIIESVNAFSSCSLSTFVFNNHKLNSGHSSIPPIFCDKLVSSLIIEAETSDSEMTEPCNLNEPDVMLRQQQAIANGISMSDVSDGNPCNYLNCAKLPFNFRFNVDNGPGSLNLISNILPKDGYHAYVGMALTLSLRRLVESRFKLDDALLEFDDQTDDKSLVSQRSSYFPLHASSNDLADRLQKLQRIRSLDRGSSKINAEHQHDNYTNVRSKMHRKLDAIRVLTRDTAFSCAEPFEGCNGYQHLRTRASGRIKDRSGRPTENGIICAISHDHAVIALSLIVGTMKFIAVKATLNNSEGNIEHFNARIDSSTLVNMQFINTNSHSSSRSVNKKRTLCVIFRNINKLSKVCVYELSLREKYLRLSGHIHNQLKNNQGESGDNSRRGKIPRISNLACEMNLHSMIVHDDSTNLVIPTVFGGSLFLGHETVTFYPKISTISNENIAVAEDTNYQQFSESDYLRKDYNLPNFRYARCWSAVESDENDLRFLICEQTGYLLLIRITLLPENNRSKQIKANNFDGDLKNMFSLNVECIGSVTNASVIVPLPFNHFFLGSRHGDHQLIRLEHSSRYRSGSTNRCPFRTAHVIKSFYSLAPIMDMRFIPTRLNPRIYEPELHRQQHVRQLVARLIDESNNKDLLIHKMLKDFIHDYCSPENNDSTALDIDNTSLHHETLVTCSNIGRQGSLRFIRNGLGLTEKICCKCPQLQAAFSLHLFLPDHVLLSYPNLSRLMCIHNVNSSILTKSDQQNSIRCRLLDDCKSSYDLDFDNRTLLVEQSNTMLCQISTKQIRLFTRRKNLIKAVSVWFPSVCRTISNSVACLNTRTIIATVGSNCLVRIQIFDESSNQQSLTMITVCERSFQNDFLSCLALDKVDNELIACGLWMKASIHLLRVIDLSTIMVVDSACIDLFIPRCISIVELNNYLHLVVGDTGGNLSFIRVNSLLATAEKHWKRIKLPCEPLFIQPVQITNLAFWMGSAPITEALFIGCKFPIMIYMSKPGKIRLINVNSKDIMHMHIWPQANQDLILMTRKSINHGKPYHSIDDSSTNAICQMELSICSIDSLNNRYIKTLKLKETAHRITYHTHSDNIVVLVYHNLPSPKLSQTAIKSELTQCASYRAPLFSQSTPSLSADNNGRPFASDLIERQFFITRPAAKRKSKDDVTDFDQPDDASMSDFGNPKDNTPSEELPEDSSQRDESTHTSFAGIDPSVLEKWLEREEHAIILIDRLNLRLKCSYFLKPYEHGCSITTCNFKSKHQSDFIAATNQDDYIIVGTGFVFDGDVEPKSGRILVFEVNRCNTPSRHCLTLVSETKVDGAVYSMSPLNGLLVVTVNCRVKLYGFVRESISNSERSPNPALMLHDCHSTNSLALYVKCKYNRCLVGDLLRSVELFEIRRSRMPPGCLDSDLDQQDRKDSSDNDDKHANEIERHKSFKLRSLARDHNPNWITSIEVLEPNIFAATENFSNLFMCSFGSPANEDPLFPDTLNAPSQSSDLPKSIREVSLIYLGHLINVICTGRLVGDVQKDSDRTLSNDTIRNSNKLFSHSLLDAKRTVDLRSHLKSHHLLGSTSGWIGQLIPISQQLYIFLWEIQKRLQMYVKSIGRISHGDWRAFESEMRIEASSGFIDGSLIESLVGLPSDRILDVLKGMRIENTTLCVESQLEPLLGLLDDLSKEH